MKNILVAPSILSADFTVMADEILRLEKAKADWLHCDVMDGMFVKNITFGPKMIADIRKRTSLFIDTHLMVVNPERYVDNFISAGSNMLTIHVEACENVLDTLQHIRSCGIKCGIAISPDTPIETAYKYAKDCDLVLIMSVYPGFGGQAFKAEVLDKVIKMAAYIEKNSLNTLIEIDGGITIENVANIRNAGADVIVAGNSIFNGSSMTDIVLQMRG